MGYLEISYVGILSIVPLNQQTHISIPCEDVLLLVSVALGVILDLSPQYCKRRVHSSCCKAALADATQSAKIWIKNVASFLIFYSMFLLFFFAKFLLYCCVFG